MDKGITNAPAVVAERARIVWLWLGGASARSVSQQTGASLSTVYRWIRRWQEEGSVRTRPFHKEKRKTLWCEQSKQRNKNKRRARTIQIPVTQESSTRQASFLGRRTQLHALVSPSAEEISSYISRLLSSNNHNTLHLYYSNFRLESLYNSQFLKNMFPCNIPWTSLSFIFVRHRNEDFLIWLCWFAD